MSRPLSVVIAEDQEADREKLELYAHRLGLSVLGSSGSGEWFIEDCEKYAPDLVMLDIGLKGLDGISAYKAILQKGLHPYLIMVSGTQDYNLILAGLEMNCIDFVTKPVTYDRLQIAVEKAKAIMEKDSAFSKKTPGNILQLKSNYRNVFVDEAKFIYAQKIKGVHKVKVYLEDKLQELQEIETSMSLTDIQAQCTDSIYAPNQSNLVSFHYISSVYPGFLLGGGYKIRLSYQDVVLDLPRRNRKAFETWYGTWSQKPLFSQRSR